MGYIGVITHLQPFTNFLGHPSGCHFCNRLNCICSVYGIGLLRRGCNFCIVCPADAFDGQPPEALKLFGVGSFVDNFDAKIDIIFGCFQK